ncbi:uncharacterized protein LOC62_07G008842 [Vanrija pseudolonga]|uniref:DUF541 domain-containing protein n=1 Tax=Vanrija pseudolonga TaxID=143232 RepID=A0AAF0YFE8_9TREE|nr:hypothetical protein LOC62_07G008842 [Vanrija pseudolonga]
MPLSSTYKPLFWLILATAVIFTFTSTPPSSSSSPASAPPNFAAMATNTAAPYTTTFLHVSGENRVERTAELADVTLKTKVEGYDQAEVLRAFKAASGDLLDSIASIAPEKTALAAGSAVDAEWPVKHQDKPVVRYSTGRLSTYSWAESSGKAISSKGSLFGSTPDPNAKRRHFAEQVVTVTFHDFASLEVFVTKALAKKHVEFVNISWRLSRVTRKALQSTVYAAAVLDAKERALDILAPLSDAPPRLKAVEVHDSSAGVGGNVQAYATREAMFGASSSKVDDSRISFVPEPIGHSVTLQVKWVVLE